MTKKWKKLGTAVWFALVLGFVLWVSAIWAYGSDGPDTVCNWSSRSISMTVEADGSWEWAWLAPGECSDWWAQDVEALWGWSCSWNGDCWYQCWKVGEGAFWITDAEEKAGAQEWAVRIDGWGTNSGWLDEWDWPAPPAWWINYRLER